MLKRIQSIDFLRGFTVLSMIIYHFFVYWVNNKNQNFGPFKEIFNFFGYLAAPFFLIISGISYYIFTRNKIEEELSKLKIFIEILKRALFIFILSTILQILFGFILEIHIEFIIYWSVFQVISFSMILFYLIQFCKKDLRISLYLVLIIFIIILEFIIKANNLTFLYLLVEGTFEFVPWASFFLFGLVFGDIFLSTSNKNMNIKLFTLIIIGICSFIFILIWINFSWFYYYNPYFFPFFIMIIGLFCILISVFYYLLDLKNLNFYLKESLNRWGRLAFSIYYFHFTVIVIGVLLFPILLSEVFNNGFLPYHFIIILILFFILLELFTKMWQKYDYFLGIEWIMNKLIKKSLFSKEKQ